MEPAAAAEPSPKRPKIKSTVVDPKVNASKPDEAAATAQKDKGSKPGKKSRGHSSNPFHKVMDQLDRQKKEQHKEPRNDEEQKSEHRRSADDEESEGPMDFLTVLISTDDLLAP